MPPRILSGTPTANRGRECTLHQSYTVDKLYRRRSASQLWARRSQHRNREASVPQASSGSNGHSNGHSNGVSNGKTLVSSNNGVVLDRKGGSLEDRILSGEFSNQGSTKEKVLRPIRQALAKDPLGPGRFKHPGFAHCTTYIVVLHCNALTKGSPCACSR